MGVPAGMANKLVCGFSESGLFLLPCLALDPYLTPGGFAGVPL